MVAPHLLGLVASGLVASAAPSLAIVSTPFDFSKGAVELSVTVRGVPMHVLLDTGVDPSLIDLSRADVLGLKVDHGPAGEASGFGEGEGAKVFDAKFDGLAINGRAFPAFDALASDMRSLSAAYGRRLDGVLGFSFLRDKVVLIDYPHATFSVLPSRAAARDLAKACRRRWSAPLRTYQSYPVVRQFRIGGATGPATVDTGFNGGVSLFPTALGLPGVRAAMSAKGVISHSGARGAASSPSYLLSVPTGFGPFVAPPDQTVTVHNAEADGARVANLGNKLFATLKAKVLLDYRQQVLTVLGDCD